MVCSLTPKTVTGPIGRRLTIITYMAEMPALKTLDWSGPHQFYAGNRPAQINLSFT